MIFHHNSRSWKIMVVSMFGNGTFESEVIIYRIKRCPYTMISELECKLNRYGVIFSDVMPWSSERIKQASCLCTEILLCKIMGSQDANIKIFSILVRLLLEPCIILGYAFEDLNGLTGRGSTIHYTCIFKHLSHFNKLGETIRINILLKMF